MPIPFKEPATEQIASLLIYQDQDYLAKHPFKFERHRINNRFIPDKGRSSRSRGV
jgi:hypothetical protein